MSTGEEIRRMIWIKNCALVLAEAKI